MRKLVVLVCAGFFLLMSLRYSGANEPENGAISPQYTNAGELIRPSDYHTWIFMGASLGMSYEEPGEVKDEGPGKFGNVYLEPTAYRHYLKTGMFPEKTIFALAVFEPASDVSINKRGYFEGEQIALEVAVKDHEQFEKGWAYFDFRMGQKTAKAFAPDKCYACHVQHAADDNVFVQFYPILRGLKASVQK